MDVPSGVRVNLAFEDVAAGADGKLFRARKVPDALQDEFVDPAMNVVALYAMTPFDTRFDFESDPGTPAKVPLTFANPAGLAANAPVEFVQHGSFVVGDLEAGDYVVVATGDVSAGRARSSRARARSGRRARRATAAGRQLALRIAARDAEPEGQPRHHAQRSQ